MRLNVSFSLTSLGTRILIGVQVQFQVALVQQRIVANEVDDRLSGEIFVAVGGDARNFNAAVADRG